MLFTDFGKTGSYFLEKRIYRVFLLPTQLAWLAVQLDFQAQGGGGDSANKGHLLQR